MKDHAIFSIYKITCAENGKAYIGFTSQPVYQRWANHVNDSKKPNHNRAFISAIRQYGKSAFQVETLYQSKDFDHTLNVMEEYFIRLHNTHINDGSGYNMNYGGSGHFNVKHSSPMASEHREKIRQAHLGKHLSPEHKAKISWKGRKHSLQTITKMKQVIRTEEFKKARRAFRPTPEQIVNRIANRTSRTWILQKPDGTLINTQHLKQTCKDNGVKYIALYAAFKQNRGINRGPTKGWKLIDSQLSV
jgi:group I intron endonuclease